uniref:Uncharacterized protein n=1 Tax=Utricularia reniformis TaxID=192314 RepID=A0A1Y0B217_9LAMI|nr:hypothetical protein AEK19_MT1221 [Utricularia reniformis]ART31434.1 hypothetical protein AEK19_MT1221 [Utricularia reniformis]
MICRKVILLSKTKSRKIGHVLSFSPYWALPSSL